MVIWIKIFKTEKTIEIQLVRLTEVCGKVLRLDNTGAWVIEVYSSLPCNQMSENVDLYIKLKLGIFSFI